MTSGLLRHSVVFRMEQIKEAPITHTWGKYSFLLYLDHYKQFSFTCQYIIITQSRRWTTLQFCTTSSSIPWLPTPGHHCGHFTNVMLLIPENWKAQEPSCLGKTSMLNGGDKSWGGKCLPSKVPVGKEKIPDFFWLSVDKNEVWFRGGSAQPTGISSYSPMQDTAVKEKQPKDRTSRTYHTVSST